MKPTYKIPQYPGNNRKKPSIKVETVKTSPKKQDTKSAVYLRGMMLGVWDSTILPMLKSMVLEAVNSTLRNTLGGGIETSRPRYSNKYQGNDNRRRTNARPTPRMTDVVLVTFATRDDAESVINAMIEVILEYGWVSIGDYYDMIGERSTAVHQRYGWDNLDDVTVKRNADGWVLDLPRPNYT